MSATRDTTVGEIVAEDFRAAAEYHRIGIEYCSGGKRSVGDARRHPGLDPPTDQAEVTVACPMPRLAPVSSMMRREVLDEEDISKSR